MNMLEDIFADLDYFFTALENLNFQYMVCKDQVEEVEAYYDARSTDLYEKIKGIWDDLTIEEKEKFKEWSRLMYG